MFTWFIVNQDLETAKTLVLIALILNVIGFIFALFTIFLAALPFIFMILDYFLVYKPLTEGKGESAEAPALVFGILQLILGGVISGVVLIVAWLKIRDANKKPSIV